MSDPATLLWLVPAFPLLGALLAALMGGKSKGLAAVPVAVGAAAAFVCAYQIVGLVSASEAHRVVADAGTWFSIGKMKVNYVLSADPLTCVMLLVITFIGFWIVVFAKGYMSHDAHTPRFFAVVGLFISAMTVLVLADNFILMLLGWEGVGLCSYLLVGYWYYKPSAAAAARKAFLVTRLGDVGMLLGIMVLWSRCGFTFDFPKIFAELPRIAADEPGWLITAGLLLLCGAVGKSAQFPLYVWLPDAMEGPTPVSALIHAATMVTAGVYLVARCSAVFMLSPYLGVMISGIGAVTAIVAAYIALTQHDLKRVLAYSTVSQLGYMFMGLGCGAAISPVFAVTAAIFHLFTHAFFKAVLFLGSGSVMHATGDVIDMRRFSGLRKVLPWTHLTFLCGSLALAGVPLLAGFFSKDMILEALQESSHHSALYPNCYAAYFIVGLVTAFMTAFYTFRAYFRTFWGPERIPEEAHGHAHESPPVMTVPLFVLAAGALFAGLVGEGLTGWFSHWLEKTPSLTNFVAAARPEFLTPHEHVTNWGLLVGSSVLALGGIALAYRMYVQKPAAAEAVARRFPKAYGLSYFRLFVDEIYAVVFIAPTRFLAFLSGRGVEPALDEATRAFGNAPRALGAVLRPMQNGLVQFYALAMALGVVAFVGYLIFWPGR